MLQGSADTFPLSQEKQLASKSKKPSAAREQLAVFIEEFGHAIPRLQAIREGIDLYGATGFSPFTIFAPNENALSRVIIELFDPFGSHGQGPLFLNAMLEAINVPRVGRNTKVRVRREVMTRGGRRIDVVIDTPTYVIGIENKPWAIQQPRQLEDYRDELLADLLGRTPVLIFLSDQNEQSAHGDVVKIPYFAAEDETSLYGILSKAIPEIKAVKPLTFVQDFKSYIDLNFGNGKMEDESTKPYRDAVNAEFDDAAKRKAIATVLLSQETLHLRIISEIGSHLLSEVQHELGADFTPLDESTMGDRLYWKYHSWGVRKTSWPPNCWVSVEAQSEFFDKLIFGVRAPDGTRIPASSKGEACPSRSKLEKLASDIPGGRKNQWWPWYQSVQDPYWGQEFAAQLVLESPTGRIKDHPTIQHLTRQFVELSVAVDKALST